MKFIIDTSIFFPHQILWWELTNFIKLLVGGYGCGKTYIGALRTLWLSFLNSGYPGMYVSPTYTMAIKTIIPTLHEIASRSHLLMTHNKTTHEFIIKNWAGRFWIGSGDNPDSLRGPNLAWAGIDEPFIQDKEVLNQMLARLRVGEHRELFLTGTPEELNWGYDLAMNDSKKYDVGCIFGKTKDNTAVPSSYYEHLYNAYSPEMREAYLEGKFINLREGKVYKPFDREKHVKHVDIEAIDKQRNVQYKLEICAGIDFNVDYMTAEIFAKGNGWMHFIDEIRLSHSNSFELAEVLQKRYPGIVVYPDATGAFRKASSSKSDHAIFKDYGFTIRARRGNPRVMDRVNTVNRLLLKGWLSIEPGRCEWLVKDLERNTWDSGDVNKKDVEMTHAADAGGYPAYYLFPFRREFGGIDRFDN